MLEYPIENLCNCIGHAKYIGFPVIEYTDRNWDEFHKWKKSLSEEERRLYFKGSIQEPNFCFITKQRFHSIRDIAIIAMFPQTWGTTSLGFDGLGGAAITTAYTIVLESNKFPIFLIYFGGKFAYKLEKPNKLFFEDLTSNFLVNVMEYKNRYLGNPNEK